MAKMDPSKHCQGTDCGKALSFFNKTGFCVDHNPQRWRVHASQRKAYFKKWNADNKDRIKNIKLKAKYGMTLEEYQKKLQSQNGVCEICKHPRPKGKPLVVDHHHDSGQIRDLLCSNCNQALGLVYESVERLEAMVQYLKKHHG